MSRKYASQINEAELPNTDEVSSTALINIETRDLQKAFPVMRPKDYSATYPNRDRAVTATSPYPPPRKGSSILDDKSPGLPRSVRAMGKGDDSSQNDGTRDGPSSIERDNVNLDKQ